MIIKKHILLKQHKLNQLVLIKIPFQELNKIA